MKKTFFALLLIPFTIINVLGQNWSTTGGSSLRNGMSVSFGPESVSVPFWSVTDASSSVWGNAVFTSGEYFATSRVKFSPAYHVISECRKVMDGSLVWDKEFPGDGKLYVVGMNEDAVYVNNYATDSLYAFSRHSGEMKWVCPQKATIFGGAHGILFACNGDPVVNGPDTYEKSMMRLDKYSGTPLWYNTNLTSIAPAPDYCIFGNRLYRWEGAIGAPTHLVAVDLETGQNLFYSDALGGDPDQEHPLTAGPDGTIYGQRDGGDLWAFVDEGNSFAVKWFYSPENGGMGTYGNIGIGPDWSVYYPDGNVIKRLDPSNGQVLNVSETLSTDAMFGTYITTDNFGSVYISNAEAAEGKYFAFSADLQTKLWEKAITYNYYAGPQISKDGIFIMAGNGTIIQAYKTALPHSTVSWFEADQTHIPQNSIVTFTDMSSFGPDSWHWIFEGGSPQESFLQNPGPVYYLNPGIFSVTLITSNSLGADTLIRECYIDVDAVPGVSVVCKNKVIEIYPNPCDGDFHIVLPWILDEPADCRIFNICGKEEYQFKLTQTDNAIRSSLSEGIYLIRITLEDQVLSGRLFVR